MEQKATTMAGLSNTISAIKLVAMSQPAVNSAVEGDAYSILNGNRSVRYPSIIITQREHVQEEDFFKFRFFIIYVDRLLQNLEQNRLEIQSNGIDVLRNIILTLEEKFDFDFPKVKYIPFEQKFADETAGVYCDAEILVPCDWNCAELFAEFNS